MRIQREADTVGAQLESNASDASIPTASYPSSLAARTVVPEPQNGSRILPPGSQIFTRSRMSGSGFSVTWVRCCGFAYRNTPGRQPTGRFTGIRPLLPHTTNSLCWRNRPFCGRQVSLSHTTTPRQIHPAHCSASVMHGSCRQSMNRQTGAPSLQAFHASNSHSAIQRVQLRWSFWSPMKSGRAFSLRMLLYF